MENVWETLNGMVEDAYNELKDTEGFPLALALKIKTMFLYHSPDNPIACTYKMAYQPYRFLCPNATPEEDRLAIALAWFYELLQAYLLMTDDYVDKGDYRSNIPTWPKIFNFDTPVVFYEMQIFEQSCYFLLQKYFGHLGSVYDQICTIVRDGVHCYWKGNRMETHFSVKHINSGRVPEESFNAQSYVALTTLKNAHIHWYTPCAMAMALSGIDYNTEVERYARAKKVFIRIGNLTQVMDDYYDTYTQSEDLTDSVDTDIRRGQFTWLFMKAKELCPTKEDWEVLKDNYGKDDDACVEKVKSIFAKVDIPTVWAKYVKEEKAAIGEFIDTTLGADSGEGKYAHWLVNWLFTTFTK